MRLLDGLDVGQTRIGNELADRFSQEVVRSDFVVGVAGLDELDARVVGVEPGETELRLPALAAPLRPGAKRGEASGK